MPVKIRSRRCPAQIMQWAQCNGHTYTHPPAKEKYTNRFIARKSLECDDCDVTCNVVVTSLN